MPEEIRVPLTKVRVTGEPDDGKLSCPVRRGADGKVPNRVTRRQPTLHYPVQIPKLSMDLVKRLYPLCQRLQIPMDQFVSEALVQAVAKAEERLEQKEVELRPAAAG